MQRVLDVAVPKIGLQRAGIDAIVGELETAGVAQHGRVHLGLEPRGRGCPLQDPAKAGGRERRLAPGDEDEG